MLCESPPSCDIQLVSVTIQQGQVCGERCHFSVKPWRKTFLPQKFTFHRYLPSSAITVAFRHILTSLQPGFICTQFLQLYLPTICKCRVFNISMPAAFQSPIKTAWTNSSTAENSPFKTPSFCCRKINRLLGRSIACPDRTSQIKWDNIMGYFTAGKQLQ